MLATVPRRKPREEVAERITESIAPERLVPGDRLPTESDLVGKFFGVSRLSVREASKALEFLGILAATAGVGLTVGQSDQRPVFARFASARAAQKLQQIAQFLPG